MPWEEKELYQKLGVLTKDKAQWEENIPFVASLLKGQPVKITGKALWMLGEMGLLYPKEVRPFLDQIAAFLDAEAPFLRERAMNALGRIGRADHTLVQPYREKMFVTAQDESPNVRLSFIWASENIATNAPDFYENAVPLFEALLDDENIRVRTEAPEMFRVLGKRRPEYVRHCIEKLRVLSEHDENRVVRIHAGGAIRAISANI